MSRYPILLGLAVGLTNLIILFQVPFRSSVIFIILLISTRILSQTTSTEYSTTTLPSSTTTSTVSVDAPTVVPSSDSYTLLGCYKELPLGENRAVGNAGDFVAPILIPETLTVPICLDACKGSSTTNDTGNYTFAAVENSRYTTSYPLLH